jgi:hypothetical protein
MAIINRGSGKTPSERYLAKVADHTFLDLWSYPNVFNDKRPQPTAQGKELCDLLVVCDPYVLIFSDKYIEWPGDQNTPLSWKRWYKRAVTHSVTQLRGAERWIALHPDRIYIDPDCKQKLPIPLPPPDRRIVHGIVIAGGIREACIRYFKGGIGSLALDGRIAGDSNIPPPFTVGDADTEGPFVHIMDEVSLDVVVSELDTIRDFADYLDRKAAAFRSGLFGASQGEEDLLAYYLTHTNSKDEHNFTRDDGSEWPAESKILIQPGTYAEMRGHRQYAAKKKADEPSYLWDNLISIFTKPMLDGTTIVHGDDPFDIARLEIGVRQMALVPRLTRRYLGLGIKEALETSKEQPRFVRAFMPAPEERNVETAFLFLTLQLPDPLPTGGYEEYRKLRINMLRTYVLAYLRQEPRLPAIVGIATEPLLSNSADGRSEDLVYAEQLEWTAQLIAGLEKDQQNFDVLRPERVKRTLISGDEYPKTPVPTVRFSDQMPMNRKQRRAAESRNRRKRR